MRAHTNASRGLPAQRNRVLSVPVNSGGSAVWSRPAVRPACLGAHRVRQAPQFRTTRTSRDAVIRITAAAHAAAAEQQPASQSSMWPALKLAAQILRPDSWLLAVTAVTLISTICTTLVFPLVIGELFDLVRMATAAAAPAPAAAGAPWALGPLPEPARRVIIHLVTCLVLSTLGNAAVAVLSPLLAERFGLRLRNRLMQALLSKDQAFFDRTPKGDIVSRITLDVTVLQTTLADYLGQRGFRSAFEVVGSILLMGARQPLLAVSALLVTPLLNRLLRGVVVRSATIAAERQQAAAAALEFASERLRHVQTVQVFAQQQREAEAFGELSEEGYRLAQKYAAFQGMVEGFGRLVVNSGTLMLLSVGGWLVLSGQTTVGTVLSAQVQVLFLSVGLSSVAASLGELGKAIGALERIAAVVDSNSADASGVAGAVERGTQHAGKTLADEQGRHGSVPEVGSVTGLVEFQDVWFRYPGQQAWVLQGFSLTIQPGDTVALVGQSGGGKSTVAALLLGLYQPQRGAVLVDGRPLTTEWLKVVRSSMAAVLQQPMLMQGSVAELIQYGRPGASMEQVVAAARAASADDFIRQLPQGYDTPVGERGHTLSGGQKQRLAIARALLLQPKLLVLDEVTSALDVESEAAIDHALQLLPGCTKLMVAHRLSTVRSANAIAVVEGGRVVEQGTHDVLASRVDGAYWRLLQASELARDDWTEAGMPHQLVVEAASP